MSGRQGRWHQLGEREGEGAGGCDLAGVHREEGEWAEETGK